MNERERREVLIFNTALELSSSLERAAYLDQACADNEELRKKIESLLRVRAEADDFFGTAGDPIVARPLAGVSPSDGSGVQTPKAGTLGGTAIVSITEKPGDKIGRYKLLQQIGEGGCGVVYMAEQEEPVRRRVALKIIKPGLDTKSVIARFEAERQALALMDHPNIAKVFDGGVTEEVRSERDEGRSATPADSRPSTLVPPTGRPYFVMELVRGIRITDYCDQAHLSTEERLKLFIQVCQAVQHAHQKGIIHRDIKPSNILVTVNDGVAVPKVIDFGIAKATDQHLTDKTYFTQFHAFIGTPAYTSPEQAEMSSLDIDTRSDIYSLGVLLYELLTGQTPFPAERLLQSGLDEMRRIIREEEPPKPSTRLTQEQSATRSTGSGQSEIRNLKSEIDQDLDWIVMKALEKDRTRRYATSLDFAADVQRHLDSEPILARAPSPLYRAAKAFKRNKVAFIAAALVMASLTTGLGISTWMFFRERDARSAAMASAQAERKAKEAEASNRRQAQEVSEYLINALRSPDPSRDGQSITVAELLDRNARQLQDKFKTDPRTKARLLSTLGRAYVGLGLVEKSVSLFEESVELLARVAGDKAPETLAAKQELALQYWALRKPEKALPLAEFLYATRLTSLGAKHPDTILAEMAIGNYLFALGRREDGLSKFAAGFNLLKERWGPDHPEMFWPTTGLAEKYRAMGRFQEALQLSEPLLQRRRDKLGNDHPDTLRSMRDVVDDTIALGRYNDALPLLQETVASSKSRLGATHRQTLASLRTLIDLLVKLQDFARAEKLCREELNLREQHPDKLTREASPTLRRQLYDLLSYQRRWAEAEVVARQVLEQPAKTPAAAASLDHESNYDLARVLYFQSKITQKAMLRQSDVTPLTKRNSWSGSELLRTWSGNTNALRWARALSDSGIHYRARQEVDDTWNVVITSETFSDLKVFAGANVSSLNLYKTAVTDISPASGLPLRALTLMRTGVRDLTPLRGAPLLELLLLDTEVTDLSPLRGSKLEKLQCNRHTTDLSPLRGLPLVELQAGRCTNVVDFTPLASIPTLENLLLPATATNIGFLRQLPKLKRISFRWDMSVHRPAQTAEEFWAEYDQRQKSK